VYCGQAVTAKQPWITISNTDADGRRHSLVWHAPCTHIDPVYRAVCESPRVPGNALLVIHDRQQARRRTGR